METIKRKTMLYKTGVEYGDYTMNHVLGCAHGCLYPCYAFIMAKRFKNVKDYQDWCSPKLVENTLDILDEEIPRLKNKIKSVQLCFTTDPFMSGYDEVSQMSFAAIEKLNDAEIPCVVLTKGILPIDLRELSRRNEYGITLVSLDENFREKYEPNAAPLQRRLGALRALHSEGFKTWVSIEPYPTPNIIDQNLLTILESVQFVDKIIFGRMNYNKEISSYRSSKEFYNRQSDLVVDFCEQYNIVYHIKEGTISQL